MVRCFNNVSSGPERYAAAPARDAGGSRGASSRPLKRSRPTADAGLRIGTRRQLFIDDFVIEGMERVRRSVHPATKHPANPVLRGEKPWEVSAEGVRYVSVFGAVAQAPSPVHGRRERAADTPEGGCATCVGAQDVYPERRRRAAPLRMWYLASDGKLRCQCLAESQDGITWTRPTLGLIADSTGSKDNNIVVAPETHSGYKEGFAPVRDPNPRDPQRRYRSLFAGTGGGVHGAWSPDGVRWTGSDRPVVGEEALCIGSIMYDTIKERWIFFARPRKNYLSRAISFSDDFETWTPLQVIFQGSQENREDYYNMTGFCYEGIYLGFIVIFWEEANRYALEPHLVMSRDGENWERVDRHNAFIPCGPRGSWDEFNNHMAAGDPIRMGDRLCFYYSGRTYPHRPKFGDQSIIPQQVLPSEAAIGLATLRVDGFVSLEDYHGGGTVTTRLLALAGRRLHVNADCGFGELRVEVLDRDGSPVPGYAASECRPLRADSIDLPVRWRNRSSLRALASTPVRLRFHLNKTRLYSFWVE